jgi:hypothetical protein
LNCQVLEFSDIAHAIQDWTSGSRLKFTAWIKSRYNWFFINRFREQICDINVFLE